MDEKRKAGGADKKRPAKGNLNMRNLEELEDIIGYHFHNKKLLRQAMIHSSYANEKKLGHRGSNERLEFLGDADVINRVIR